MTTIHPPVPALGDLDPGWATKVRNQMLVDTVAVVVDSLADRDAITDMREGDVCVVGSRTYKWDGEAWKPVAGDVHVRDFDARGDGRYVFDGAMTSGSATLTCAASAPFTADDVGKVVLVNDADHPDALSSTIAAFVSASVVTLADAATETVSAMLVCFGTDDTAAIQAASDAAAAANTTADFDAAVYCVAGPCVTSRQGNAQITLPNYVYADGEPDAKVGYLGWHGPTKQGFATDNGMPYPPVSGTIIQSFLVGQSYDADAGIPSVVGGPTAEQIGDNSSFSNMTFAVDGVCVRTPHNPSLANVDLEMIGRLVAPDLRCDTTAGFFGHVSVDSYNDNTDAPSHESGAALLMPANNNLNTSHIQRLAIAGGHFAGLVIGEHANVDQLQIFAAAIPLAVRVLGDGYDTQWVHGARFGYVSVEGCPYGISGWRADTGLAGIPHASDDLCTIDIQMLDIENHPAVSTWRDPVNQISDPNNALRGRIGYLWFKNTLSPQLADLDVDGGDELHLVRLDTAHKDNEAAFVVGAAGAPAYTNDWAAYSDDEYVPVRVRKAAGMVFLEGLCQHTGSTTGGSSIFTLPDGFRPGAKVMLPTWMAGKLGIIVVDFDGTVIPYVSDGTTDISGGVDVAGSFQADV